MFVFNPTNVFNKLFRCPTSANVELIPDRYSLDEKKKSERFPQWINMRVTRMCCARYQLIFY